MKKKIVSCLLVAVMCTLIGSVAYADEYESVGRAGSIKSHGTLLCEQADADDEVYITTQDLIYLANEMDILENIIDGLQCKDSPYIVYDYHNHTGNSSMYGGCYTVERRGQGTPIYGNCSHTVERHQATEFNDGDAVSWISYLSEGSEPSCTTRQTNGRYESGASYSHQVTVGYNNDGPILGYNLGCGWTQGAIESAHIEFKAH